MPLDYAGAPVPKRLNQLGFADSETIGKFKPAELGVSERVRDAQRENHHEEIETLRKLEETKHLDDRNASE